MLTFPSASHFTNSVLIFFSSFSPPFRAFSLAALVSTTNKAGKDPIRSFSTFTMPQSPTRGETSKWSSRCLGAMRLPLMLIKW